MLLRLSEIDLSREGKFNVILSAEDAAWALNRGGPNRNPSKNHVADLRERMLRGEWVDWHDDPIMFNAEGRLVNGQHRMMALLGLSGVQIKACVRTMVSDSRLAATDTVRTRRVADNLAILHDIRASTFETASVAHWDRDNRTMRPARRQRGVPVWEYRQVVNDWPLEMELLSDFAKLRRPMVRVSGVGVALLVAAQNDLHKAREFFMALVNPASPCLQAQFLFRTLTENRRFYAAEGYDEQVLRFKYALTAFDCFQRQQPLTKWGKLRETLDD